jgi:ADP-dependent NAD(P)H-hydrate dehydratase
MSPRADAARRVTPALLRRWPLPRPSSDSDKEDRGAVLVAGGSREVPGALILSALAALRAGAGKLQVAAPVSVAPTLGTLLMEARVVALPESRDGSLGKSAGRMLRSLDDDSSAVLAGPGMIDTGEAASFIKEYLRGTRDCPLVLDASCVSGLSLSDHLGNRVVLTPHAGEMASMLDADKKAISRDPAPFAIEVSQKLGAVVVLKGARTFIAAGSDLFVYDGGDVGLATSGSGDVLSGILAGLLARGVDPLQASVWAVFIHGSAGNALARRIGKIGFLARELLDEIPRAMNTSARSR